MHQHHPTECPTHRREVRNLFAVFTLIYKGYKLQKKVRKSTCMERKSEESAERKHRKLDTSKYDPKFNITPEVHQHRVRSRSGSIDDSITTGFTCDYNAYLARGTLKFSPYDGMLGTNSSDESWQEILRKLEADIKGKKDWRL